MKLPDWILVFLLFFSFYLLLFGRAQEYSYADGSLMYKVTKSIVEDGSFKSQVPGFYRGGVFIESSKYGLGFSIVVVPFYIATKIFAQWFDPKIIEVFTRFAPMFANVFITALTCAILFLFSYHLFSSKRIAFIVTILYGFATLAWPYSRYDFSEPLTSLCLLYSIYALFRFQITHKKYWIMLSSIALSYAIFTRVVEFVIIPIWFFYLLWIFKKENIKPNITLSMRAIFPLIITIILFFWYNFYRYGDITSTGYEHDIYSSRMFFKTMFTGLYGLLLSPGKGVFWYSPSLILSLVAYPIFWKKDRSLFIVCLAVILVHLFIYSGWIAWEGGWCWGPRNLVPIITLLILPIGYWIRKYQWSSFIWITLLSYGIIVQFLGIVYPFNIYIQSTIEQGVNFNDLLFKYHYNPISGNLLLAIELPKELWDFAFIPLLSSSYRQITIGGATILILIFAISGTLLIKRVRVSAMVNHEK